MVATLSDTFPEAMRKNPSFIKTSKIRLVSRVISAQISANKQNLDVDSEDFGKFGERCDADEKLLVRRGVKATFAVRSNKPKPVGRKLNSYFEDLPSNEVNILTLLKTKRTSVLTRFCSRFGTTTA